MYKVLLFKFRRHLCKLNGLLFQELQQGKSWFRVALCPWARQGFRANAFLSVSSFSCKCLHFHKNRTRFEKEAKGDIKSPASR